MVARTALLVACLLLGGCSGFFDSYFPVTTEYLETQTNVASVLGGEPVASAQIGYLPAGARSSDLLVLVAVTQDGVSHVLFYDPTNLSLLRSYGGSDLPQASGATPDLALITQDSTQLYTGVVAYDPSSLAVQSSLVTLAYFGSQYPRFSGLKATYGPSGTNNFYTVASGSLELCTSTTYPSVPSTGVSVSLSGGSSVSVQDALYVAGTTYLVATLGSQVALLRAASATPTSLLASAVLVSASNSSGSAWATATAAIVEEHGNNAIVLQAYSWSGSALANVVVSNDHNPVLAFGFQPNGQAWFLFDSSTGKLSREVPWW